MVERFRELLSNEKVADRIARMVAQLERAAAAPAEGNARASTGEQAAPTAEAVQATLTFGRERDGPPRPPLPRRRRPARPRP
jgi:ATP-dependent Lhr-like helicase